MTVAWDASSLIPIMLAGWGGFGLPGTTPVLTRRQRGGMGIESAIDAACSPGKINTAATYNKRPLGRSLNFWGGVRTNAGRVINLALSAANRGSSRPCLFGGRLGRKR